MDAEREENLHQLPQEVRKKLLEDCRELAETNGGAVPQLLPKLQSEAQFEPVSEH